MADFETMPIGTRAALKETAELLRSYERHHREIATRTGARTGRDEKAQRNADAAAKLEALLAGVGVYPR